MSKKQNKEILNKAREKFRNVNFSDNSGLLIEAEDEINVFRFCLEICEEYKATFGSWNGYEIKKMSQRIFFNYADRKRKLKFDYFKKIVQENNISDIKLVLAGILYLEPDEVLDLLITTEKKFGNSFKKMLEDEIKDAYNILIMYASSKERKFSLN